MRKEKILLVDDYEDILEMLKYLLEVAGYDIYTASNGLDGLNLAKKITNTPIVAIGGIKLNNYKKLLLNKANFLAISSYIWNNNKYKPIEAIKKLK